MKFLKFIAFASMSLLISSCNEMENAPTNKFTDDSFWTSSTKAQYVVNKAYSQMYSAGQMWTDESLSDNVYDGRSVNDQRTIRRGMATPALDLFKNEWSSLYSGIKTCHIFLQKIDLVPNMDPNLKARMIAEIRFIRASLYFRLTNLYGAVPFFTQEVSLEESLKISRTDRETIINFIHQELSDIVDVLPTRDQLPDSERGKITKGAVETLQARVYLMDSDWENVMIHCDNLMSKQNEYGTYRLFNNYAGLFKETNEYNEEVIMDRSYVPNVITWKEMEEMAPRSRGGNNANRVPQQSLVDTYLTLSGKTINESGTDYNKSKPYENRDPRLTATIVYDNYKWSENIDDGSNDVVIKIHPNSKTIDAYDGGNNSTATGYYTSKYYNPQAPGNMNSGVNIITMRYADILLMYAEAYHEQNSMTEEVWDKTIRPIRQRAGFTEESALAFPEGKSKQEMQKIIRDERRVELALEGLRWFDIKRWKAGTEYLTGRVRGASFVDANKLDNRSFDESKDYFWAVPISEIDLNPNLAPNNPGYSN